MATAGWPNSGAHQRALTEAAIDILRKKPGERITTSLELQERLDVGSGTVQKALRQLVDIGAVRLKVKGHQGTVIVSYDPALLWQSADLGPLRLALTPPGSIELTALAIEVRSQLAPLHVSTEFDFVRGATQRVALLKGDQPRVAALSWVAASTLGVLDDPAYSYLDLGPLTYYRPETLVVLERPDADQHPVHRIARDSESYDHEKLTLMQYPESGGYEYVECPFPEVPAAILTGRVDAGIWHRVVTAITPEQAGLRISNVAWEPNDLSAESIARAVLVWRSDFAEIDTLLGLLDLDSIAKAQENLAVLGIGSSEVRQAVPWL